MKQHSKLHCYYFVVAAFLCFNIKTLQAQPGIDTASLSTYIENARQMWKVPGIAVAIVQDGKVLYSRGFGVRNADTRKPVDGNTIFAVASNTKAFTASAIGILVDQGKLNWDDKVQKYLPWFKMYDPYVSENMTITDLLCHRAGLETFSGDLLWYHTTYDTRQVVERARYLKPVAPFRASSGYSNLMFSTAGLVIEQVTGQTWQTFINDQFIQPLGMKNTVLTTKKLDLSKNVATPHHVAHDGSTTVVPYLDWDNAPAAAAVISSVNDMSRWMMMQLANGELDGKRYLSDKSLRYTRQLHNATPVGKRSEELFPSTHFKGIGLGWFMQDYMGAKILNHGGGSDGMISRVCLVPEKNFGFVILTNSINNIPSALYYYMLDDFFDKPTQDWNKMFWEWEQDDIKQAEADKVKDVQARNSNAKASLPLEQYAGTYGGDLYGDVVVAVEKDKLVLRFAPAPDLVGDLEHWHYDTFTIKLRNLLVLPEGKVTFVLDANGKPEELRINIPNPDFDFTELELKRKE